MTGTGVVSVLARNQRQYLDRIAEAKAITNNMYSSAQVKTGAGTALSNFCLSRLRNSHNYQLLTQNRRMRSASREMSYVKNLRGFFEGIASRRELMTKTQAKTSTEFSSIEQYTLSFLNDWVGAFVPKHNNAAAAGDGHAIFLPTVNSDKSQIDGLRVNLNAYSHYYYKNGELKVWKTEEEFKNLEKDPNAEIIRYRDLTDSQLMGEMRQEFGPLYTNIINNILSELTRLTDVLGITEQVKSKYIAGNLAQNWNSTLADIQAYFENQGINASKGIHRVLTDYNKTHTRNPIQLSEQIHFITDKKGNLGMNKTLLALWGRYNDTYAYTTPYLNYKQPSIRNGQLQDVDYSYAQTLEGFCRMKDGETVLQLLKDGFKLYLSGNKKLQQKEVEYLAGKMEGMDPQQASELAKWKTHSGVMALARIPNTNRFGGQYEYTNDIAKIEAALDNDTPIEFHPMITRMNKWIIYLLNSIFAALEALIMFIKVEVQVCYKKNLQDGQHLINVMYVTLLLYINSKTKLLMEFLILTITQ